MTIIHKNPGVMSKCSNDQLIDHLRACQTEEEILKFEKWFNAKNEYEELYKLICELLRNRSISRALAAKWLYTLLNDRHQQLNSYKTSI